MRARTLFGLLAAAMGVVGPAVAVQQRLSLGESIEIALRDNPQIRAARAARDAAIAEAEKTRPRFGPDVRAAVRQFVRGPRVDFPKRGRQVTVLPNAHTQIDIHAQQPLYQFGAGKSPQQRSTALEDAADADFRKAELDLAAEVELAFINALLAEAMERVAAEGVTLAQEQLRVTRAQVDAGQLAEVEILQGEQSLAEAEAGLIRARNGILLGKANLNRLLKRPQGEPLVLEPLRDTPTEPGTTEQMLPEAMSQRPEAQALRARITAAEAGARLARSVRQPRVSGDAEAALQTPSAFVPTSSWLVGVTASVPIFSTAVDRANIQQARAGVEQARSSLEMLEQGIALEIEQARIAYLEARDRLKVAEIGLSRAREAYRIRLAALQAQRAIPFEVAASRLEVTRAESQREQAVFDMWLAHARLRRATGEPPAPGS